MSVRGVGQLQSLKLLYCRHSGSSRGVRDFLRSAFDSYASAHASIAISSETAPGRHPHVVASYANGSTKVITLKNEDQEAIAQRLESLRKQSGRKAREFWPNVESAYDIRSVQGFWNPKLGLALANAQAKKQQ
ncbi:mitochondrial ribosomal protein L43 (mL43) [Andalucia godoyi]|uniref:Large ribosomal subunit protein mL43 n=1 Tax=Andalucia godoyi TaxID=505711 RepID=A0A8K0AI98_ANDGO|nr:mitochondrial ribosomal protein L43 (mL43) [Andalucia godoyi]|eukprot:ANDGO_08761.mRNA.1 mitochondrial ribosomal protein L43 (mL43)